MKRVIFVAGSSRDAAVVETLAGSLGGALEVRPWVEGQAELGRDILEWAISEARRCDFGLFVLAPDSRWGRQPNGNVLLEYGLFAAALGPDRCFILKETGTKLPSDLGGRIIAKYDAGQFRKRGAAALDKACEEVRGALRRRRSLADEVQGLWLERKRDVGKAEGPLSLVQFEVRGGTARVRGRSYNRKSVARVNWPDELNVCWLRPGRDELFHMFDAKYGKSDSHSALGVTLFRFRPDREKGRGHFVVHGSGDIKKGAVEFDLERITPEYLRRLGLDPAPFSLEQEERCTELIRVLHGKRDRG